MKNLITIIALLLSVSAVGQVCTGIVDPNTLSKDDTDCSTYIDTYHDKTYTFVSGTTWAETGSIGGTMSNWTLAADSGTPATISNGNTATIAGSTEGIDVAISGSTATVSLDYSEVAVTTSLGGNEYFQLYDVTDGNRQINVDSLPDYLGGSMGIFSGSGTIPDNTTAQTAAGAGFIVDGEGYIQITGTEILANADIWATNAPSISFTDRDGEGTETIMLIDGVMSYTPGTAATTDYVDNLALGAGSITIPDGSVTAINSDGSGIEWDGDNLNFTGVNVTVNGVQIPMRDTLVIPIYAAPYDQAPTADDDYRGWRVPADLNGARIIGVHYSFDTPGSDDVLVQVGNGTVNIGGATIPPSGYVDVTANRTLATGEIWRPDVLSISGTSHLGFTFQLIIERK